MLQRCARCESFARDTCGILVSSVAALPPGKVELFLLNVEDSELLAVANWNALW